MQYDSDILFLSWEKHRRSFWLCDYFKFRYFFFSVSLPRYIKHPYLIVRTIWMLTRERPRILIVQNPSIVLASLGCLFRVFFRYKLVLDAHNAAIVPEGWAKKICFLYGYVQRVADLTIVTNKNLARVVLGNRGNPFVLPDKIPEIDTNELSCCSYDGIEDKVVFICSFHADEPYEEVFSVFYKLEKLERNLTVYVTGAVPRTIQNRFGKCGHIVFTGYLRELEYWSLLYCADLIIDLTTRNNCMVCAAYEGVAVGVPVLLSDTVVQKKYFYKGCLFTFNEEEAVMDRILQGLNESRSLRRKVDELRSELDAKWKISADELITTLNLL